MNTSVIDVFPKATAVHCTVDVLVVSLADGRSISVPLVWFPRLVAATSSQRENFEFIGDGSGIHWPDIDEDVSVNGLLAGTPSLEYRRAAGQHHVATDN